MDLKFEGHLIILSYSCFEFRYIKNYIKGEKRKFSWVRQGKHRKNGNIYFTLNFNRLIDCWVCVHNKEENNMSNIYLKK